MSEKIGVIGLGNAGGAVASSLAKKILKKYPKSKPSVGISPKYRRNIIFGQIHWRAFQNEIFIYDKQLDVWNNIFTSPCNNVQNCIFRTPFKIITSFDQPIIWSPFKIIFTQLCNIISQTPIGDIVKVHNLVWYWRCFFVAICGTNYHQTKLWTFTISPIGVLEISY